MRAQRAGKVRYRIAIGLLLLVGCSHRYRNALHPSYGQTDFDRDWDDCQRQNTHPPATAAIGAGPTVAYRDYPMAQACMRARGWQRTE
jgi:hypothetical protein